MNNNLFLWFFVIFISCGENNNKPIYNENIESTVEFVDTIEKIEKKISLLESRLINAGLVDIQNIDTSLHIDIKYSTKDNFMKMNLYGDYDKAYLQVDVAKKLSIAQSNLKKINSNYSLLIYDGTRPRYVQQMMWDSLDLPINEKTKFVSNPKNGSIHNYGAAVDLTIIKIDGEILDMGTPYDDISKKAYPRLEKVFLKKGDLTIKQVTNRKLLRKVMGEAGFYNIQTEWWHFNSCTRKMAKELYNIIE